MKAEEVLREPEKLARRIVILSREIEGARRSLEPGGVDYSADRVQASPVDKYPAIMDVIIRKEEQLAQLVTRRRWLIYERIPGLLEKVTNDLARDIIAAYYTTDATMAEVAEMCSVSNMTAYRYRWMGLADIQKALDAES